MEKLRWVLAGVAGLGLFTAGYLAGRQHVGESPGGSEISPPTAHRPDRRNSSDSRPVRIKAKPALKPPDEKQAGYRKIVDLVSKGELRISDLRIDRDTFLPGPSVGEFFDLSDDQLAEMKRLGLEQLQKKKDRERSQVKILEVSESGMVFDLPADREFVAAEVAGFVEDLRLAFGADVAAMLQRSIREAYREFNSPRHVRYSFTQPDDATLPPDAPESLRAMRKGRRNFKITETRDEEVSRVDHSNRLRSVSSTKSGFFNPNDTDPNAFRPPYYDLWEREMGHR